MSAFSQLVEKRFIEAKESKDLISFDTTVAKKECNGVEVYILVETKKEATKDIFWCIFLV
jgi:hypothetical protein